MVGHVLCLLTLITFSLMAVVFNDLAANKQVTKDMDLGTQTRIIAKEATQDLRGNIFEKHCENRREHYFKCHVNFNLTENTE